MVRHFIVKHDHSLSLSKLGHFIVALSACVGVEASLLLHIQSLTITVLSDKNHPLP